MFIDLGFRIGSISNRKKSDDKWKYMFGLAQGIELKLTKIFHLCDSHGKINRARKMSNERNKKKKRKEKSWNERQNPTQKSLTHTCRICMYIVWSVVINAKQHLIRTRYWWMLLFCLFVSFYSVLSISRSFSPSLLVSLWHLCVPFTLQKKSIDWVNDISFQLINTSVAHLSYVTLLVML